MPPHPSCLALLWVSCVSSWAPVRDPRVWVKREVAGAKPNRNGVTEEKWERNSYTLSGKAHDDNKSARKSDIGSQVHSTSDVIVAAVRSRQWGAALDAYHTLGVDLDAPPQRLSEDAGIGLEQQQFVLKKREFGAFARASKYAIRACEMVADWKQGSAIYFKARDMGVTMPPHSAASVMRTCANRRQWEAAARVVDDALSTNLTEAGIINVNIGLKAFLWIGAYARADALFERVSNADEVFFAPDSYTYATMVSAWCRSGKRAHAVSTLRGLATRMAATTQGRGEPPSLLTPGVFNAGILATTTQGDVEGALQFSAIARELQEQGVVAEGLFMDAASYGMLMVCCAKAGDGEGALRFLTEHSSRAAPAERPRRKGNKIQSSSSEQLSDKSIYAALWGLAEHGRARHALQVLSLVRARQSSSELFGPDAAAYHATMAACFKAERWSDLLRVLEDMRGAGVRPDGVAYSMALKACENNAAMAQTPAILDLGSRTTFESLFDDELLQDLDGTRDKHLEPPPPIEGWERAVAILRDAESNGQATVSMYARVLLFLGKHGRARSAVSVFNRLLLSNEGRGTQEAERGGSGSGERSPCPMCCLGVVLAHSRSGDAQGAEEWLGRLEEAGLPVGVEAYTSAISACRHVAAGRRQAGGESERSDWRRALRVYEEFKRHHALESGVAPLFNSLLNVLGSGGSGAGPAQAAERALSDMASSGVHWNAGTYTSVMAFHSKRMKWDTVIDLWQSCQNETQLAKHAHPLDEAAGTTAPSCTNATPASAWLALNACAMVGGESDLAESIVKTFVSQSSGGSSSTGSCVNAVDFYTVAIDACGAGIGDERLQKNADLYNPKRALSLLRDLERLLDNPEVIGPANNSTDEVGSGVRNECALNLSLPLGMSVNGKGLVCKVVAGMQAETLGLQPGDKLLSLNGDSVSSAAGLRAAMDRLKGQRKDGATQDVLVQFSRPLVTRRDTIQVSDSVAGATLAAVAVAAAAAPIGVAAAAGAAAAVGAATAWAAAAAVEAVSGESNKQPSMWAAVSDSEAEVLDAPPLKSYEAVLKVCEHGSAWRVATEVLLSMIAKGFQPSPTQFNVALRTCVRCGEWDMSYRLFRAMRSTGVPLSDIAFAPEIAAWVKTQPGGDIGGELS